jgi:hypothetical protein
MIALFSFHTAAGFLPARGFSVGFSLDSKRRRIIHHAVPEGE